MLNQEFTLPYPPSVNSHLNPILYFDEDEGVYRKKQMSTKKWKSYLKNAAKELMAQNRKRIDPNVKLKVLIEAYPPDGRKRDMDNIAKIVLDSLTKGGVYDDDSQVWEHTVRRKQEKLGQVKIFISPME